MIGRTLADRYRVTEGLHKGKALSTYIAVDSTYGSEVEVDVLELEADSPVSAQRIGEILDAAMLVHGPHIASLLAWDHDEEEGFVCMVRERTGGALLSEVLAGTGELPRRQVAEVVHAAVEVLAEAYGRGLYYLGLNPGQVVLDGRGDVKLLRVGFSWVLEELEPELASRVSPYRAPETDGKKEGSRTSDVYALAVMVREMLPAEPGERLSSLLRMAVDPLPRRRPSSPRLLLEALEAAEGDAAPGIPVPGAGAVLPPPGSGGGLSFLENETSPSLVDLSRRPRGRLLRNLLLILAGGLALWVAFAAAGGLLRGKPPETERESAAFEERITLPDLQGLTAAEAEEILDGLGLRCTTREAPSRLWSAGRVAAQEPAEGSPLQPGDAVCLVISTGADGGTSAETGGGQPQEQPGSSVVPTSMATPSPAPAAQSPRPVSPPAVPPPAVNLPPRAVPSVSANSGPAPFYVAMDGSASYDPDGGIVRYVWHCGDGTVIEGPRAQHVYDPAVIPARFQVVLEVFDAGGLSHSSAIVLEVY
ncbi:MAG: PASTA domain-containing protein [Actinomycetota bacterium]